MLISVSKENKNHGLGVILVPKSAHELINCVHGVVVEHGG